MNAEIQAIAEYYGVTSQQNKTIEEMAWFLTYYAEELDPYDENRALEWLESEYAEADGKDAK